MIRSQTLYYKPLFQVFNFPSNSKRCGSLYPQNPILKSKLKPSQCHKKLPTITHTYCCLRDHPKLSSPRKDARCLLSLACPERSGGSDLTQVWSPGFSHPAAWVGLNSLVALSGLSAHCWLGSFSLTLSLFSGATLGFFTFRVRVGASGLLEIWTKSQTPVCSAS